MAREAVRRTLSVLPTFHTGALSLVHTSRSWPTPLQDRFKQWTSLVVRLECASRPGDGKTSTAALEAAAADRLLDMVADDRKKRALARLVGRAMKHYREALKAYAKARRAGPTTTGGEVAS